GERAIARSERAHFLVGVRSAGIACEQTHLGAQDPRRQGRPRRAATGQDVQEVSRKLSVPTMMTVAGRLEMMALDPVGMVVVDDDLVLVPIELDRAAVADQRGAARRGATTG